MGDAELNAENEEDLWAAATEDLAKQKEMLRAAATGGKPAEAAAAAPAHAPAAVEEEEAPAVAVKHAPAGRVATPGEMDRILDIPLQITVELGRNKMLINDLLQLGQGSVIELTKLVGESLDVMVNDKPIAKGEVVVVNEKFGIRLTEILSPTERIENMA
ncbi:MAG: flagellar motor switch protein FliN [Nitrospinae bacterium]|nr:flagellar motor switch protein FliN [Nitrospinota bacterium]